MNNTTVTHCVFSAGRLSRAADPASLMALPGSHAAATAACRRLSTPAGIRHTAAWSSAICAARKARGDQDDGLPQQRRQDTDGAAPQPTAPRRIRSGQTHTPVEHVPWTAAVEAAVLQFWTAQGVLLPEGEVQPEQQTEQRRLRSKILRWAAKYPRHRDVNFLTDYMARVHDAAAASGWGGDPWRIALLDSTMIACNRSPASLLQGMQTIDQQLAQHNVRLAHGQRLMLAGLDAAGDTVAAKAIKVKLALDSRSISLDFAIIVKRLPRILRLKDPGEVLLRRTAAMQRLHPQLDVAWLVNKQPTLLTFAEETLAVRWASLQAASGLGDDDMRVLVEGQPSILNMPLGS